MLSMLLLFGVEHQNYTLEFKKNGKGINSKVTLLSQNRLEFRGLPVVTNVYQLLPKMSSAIFICACLHEACSFTELNVPFDVTSGFICKDKM